jgi:excisionase family DNA binding protein
MSEMVPASQAAEILGVDKRTVLRFARSGKLRAYRTPGGQHRFRREDVERLAAGDGSNCDVRLSVSTVQNKRDEVETLNLDVQARRAKRELARIESEDEAEELQRAEARRAEALANKRALAEIRAKREREREQRDAARARETEDREATRAREAAERLQRTWEAEIISEVLATLPRDVSPDAKAATSEALREALASLRPSDPRQLVAIAVSAAIARALAPWQRRKETQAAIEEAERELPLGARSYISPTEWQIRYRAAADGAVRALPADVPISQVRAAAHGEARKLAAEFDRGEIEERHRRACERIAEGTYLSGASRDEESAAKQAVKAALGKLAIGASNAELLKARDVALAPFAARIKAAKDADRYLEHIAAYVDELGDPERGEWDLGGLIERTRFTEKLRKRIRPPLVQAILAGEVEDQQDARDFIETAVDAQLDEGD